jgi:hypothetical protein
VFPRQLLIVVTSPVYLMRELRPKDPIVTTIRRRHATLLLVAAALLAGACATARQYLALSQVRFDIDNIREVRLAGVRLDNVHQASDLSPFDYGRIALAATQHNLPLEMDLHLAANNPAANNTTARLARFNWTLLLNQHETVSGALDTVYTIPPGTPTDVRVPVRLDLARYFNSNVADALDLALGLSGLSSKKTDVELRATPTIETPLGPIQYPQPIVVRRTVNATSP